jgi:hypothetical protein
MASFANGAIVISWGSAIPGRERKMLAVLKDMLDFTRKLEAAERITDTRLFVSTTGPNRDTVMLFGPLDQLSALLVDDELESMLQDGMLVVQDISVALWAGGRPEEVLSGLSVHAEKLASHGLL